MAPKKANSKKGQTKVVATNSSSSADAEIINVHEKEVVQQLKGDAKSLENGIDAENDKEFIKASAKKRSSGRGKNVSASVVGEEQAPGKKAVVKGKGKKKVIGNESVENETAVQEAEETKVNDEQETTTKAKGRGTGGKTKETKVKKSGNSIGNVEVETVDETKLEEAEDTIAAKALEKKTKATVVRKRKQELTTKDNDQIEAQHEIEQENTAKVLKNSSRNAKKKDGNLPIIETPKKKGRAVKKDSTSGNNEVKASITEEAIYQDNLETKEKKPVKRGRNAAKTANAQDVNLADSGELAEEILPTKRSRKASSTEKEIVSEKPKKGRAKKASDKVTDKSEAENTTLQGKEEAISTNGQIKMDNTESINEQPRSTKKAEKITESVDVKAAVTKARGGRKRAAPSANKKSKTTADNDKEVVDGGEDNELEDEVDGSKPSKTKKKTTSAPLNSSTTKYNKADFELAALPDGQTADEPRYNLKISSWNVAGLRSWIKKEGLKFLEYEQPDIFCMQEIKCTADQLPEEVERIPGYHPYWLCMPGGYAGVAIYSKIMPINVEYGIGNKEFDDCGRIITAEYEKFFLINVYVPNSGRKLVNLEMRMKWEKIFQEFVQKLDARKPLIICGDMNVSHQEHDLANPKSNTRNAGFTKEERDKMTELLALGYIDTFRHLYPDRKGAYTFWTYMGNARARNVGWRLDYFIVSGRFVKRVVDNCIRSQCMGSDHCPITLFLKL